MVVRNLTEISWNAWYLVAAFMLLQSTVLCIVTRLRVRAKRDEETGLYFMKCRPRAKFASYFERNKTAKIVTVMETAALALLVTYESYRWIAQAWYNLRMGEGWMVLLYLVAIFGLAIVFVALPGMGNFTFRAGSTVITFFVMLLVVEFLGGEALASLAMAPLTVIVAAKVFYLLLDFWMWLVQFPVILVLAVVNLTVMVVDAVVRGAKKLAGLAKTGASWIGNTAQLWARRHEARKTSREENAKMAKIVSISSGRSSRKHDLMTKTEGIMTTSKFLEKGEDADFIATELEKLGIQVTDADAQNY